MKIEKPYHLWWHLLWIIPMFILTFLFGEVVFKEFYSFGTSVLVNITDYPIWFPLMMLYIPFSLLIGLRKILWILIQLK